MRVLGIDPGFSSLGWAICEMFNRDLTASQCGVITTEKAKHLVQLRSSEDNIQRAQLIYHQLSKILSHNDIGLIATETMSWPRNAGVVAKMGIVWGVIASVSEQLSIPMLQASPIEIKKAVTGNGKASKEEMIASIKTKFPSLILPPQTTLQEHCADAVGAVMACQRTQLMRIVGLRDNPYDG